MRNLDSLYDDEDIKLAIANIDFARGLIFAVSAAPEIPMPEVWMPWLLLTDTKQSLEKSTADKIADGFMAQLRQTLDDMRQQKSLLPATYTWSPQRLERRNLESWLTGLLHGHQQLEECWQKAWNERPEQVNVESVAVRLRRCLKLFSTLANTDVVLSGLTAERQLAMQQNLPILAQQLPAMLKEYAALADELAQQLPNQFETFVSQGDTDE
jgi:uncharacterized protein